MESATPRFSGMKPQHDTWPGSACGVRSIGQSDGFYNGGYCSSGSMGCQPLGCFELATVPPASPSFFAGLHSTLATDFLALDIGGMNEAAAKGNEEPSPKSVVGFDFEAEVAAEQQLTTDHAEWQSGCPQD